MKNIKLIFSIAILSIALFSFTTINTSTKYKCMVQMTNYVGEGAYVVISLINPDGHYEKTLYVQGDDEEWYTEGSGFIRYVRLMPN